MKEYQSWYITGEAILDDLMALMNLSDEETALLAALTAEAQAITPELSEAFYHRLLAYAPTAEYLEGKLGRLRVTLQNWFVQLFQGSYDQAYFQKRLKVGQTHVRIGLPIRYPLAMMDVMLKFGQQVASQSPRPQQAMTAFSKLLALDIAIFYQAYEDAYLHCLAEALGDKHLARQRLLGE